MSWSWEDVEPLLSSCCRVCGIKKIDGNIHTILGFYDAQGKSQKLQTSRQAAVSSQTWTLNLLSAEALLM